MSPRIAVLGLSIAAVVLALFDDGISQITDAIVGVAFAVAYVGLVLEASRPRMLEVAGDVSEVGGPTPGIATPILEPVDPQH